MGPSFEACREENPERTPPALVLARPGWVSSQCVWNPWGLEIPGGKP